MMRGGTRTFILELEDQGYAVRDAHPVKDTRKGTRKEGRMEKEKERRKRKEKKKSKKRND